MLVEGLSRECLEDVDTSETLRLQRSISTVLKGVRGTRQIAVPIQKLVRPWS